MSATTIPKTPTKPRRYRWPRWLVPVAIVLVFGLAAAALAGWKPFVRRYAPMSQTFSQCLVCGRSRDQLTVGGSLVHDQILEHDHSRWIDSFLGPHDHLWMGATWTNRRYWFGPMSIGCGGSPNLGTIYRMREQLGEARAQAIVHEHARFVQQGPVGLKRVDGFLETLLRDPDALLD